MSDETTVNDLDLEGQTSGGASEEGGEQAATQTDPAVMERAKLYGYKEGDAYKGAPEDFKTPEQFLEIMEKNMPVKMERLRYLERTQPQLLKKMEKLEKTLEELAKGQKTADQERSERRLHNLKVQQQTAYDEGNLEEVNRLAGEIAKATPVKEDTTVTPEGQYTDEDIQVFNEWAASPEIASWIYKDQEMTLEAIDYANRLAQQGIGGAQQLQQVTTRMKRLYPERFVKQKTDTHAPGVTKPGAGKETPATSLGDQDYDAYVAARQGARQ